MFRFHQSRLRQRLVATCCLGLYGFVAVLGQGGLHAIAPCVCTAPGHATAPAKGCLGHCHAGHQHGTHGSEQEPEPTSVPCHDDGCVICKSLASPSLTPAAVEATLVENVVGSRPPRLPVQTRIGAPREILNRGPPATA